MPKILTLDEMLDVLEQLDPIDYQRRKADLETIGTQMAERIASTLNIDFDDAVSEGSAFAGTCANFYPKDSEQAEPDGLLGFDEGGEWEPRDAD